MKVTCVDSFNCLWPVATFHIEASPLCGSWHTSLQQYLSGFFKFVTQNSSADLEHNRI